MPMPDIPVWRISSTLKLAEYLASGLGIIGIDSRYGGVQYVVQGRLGDGVLIPSV